MSGKPISDRFECVVNTFKERLTISRRFSMILNASLWDVVLP